MDVFVVLNLNAFICLILMKSLLHARKYDIRWQRRSNKCLFVSSKLEMNRFHILLPGATKWIANDAACCSSRLTSTKLTAIRNRDYRDTKDQN